MNSSGSHDSQTIIKSHQRIYELASITDRKDWVGFIGLALGCLFLIAWSIFGTIDTLIVGKGMVLKSAGINTVSSSVEGMIEGFRVKVGDDVEVGQVIAKIAQNELQYQIDNLALEIENTKKRNKERLDVRNIREANLLMRVNDLSYQVSLLEKVKDKNLEAERNLIETREKLGEAQNELEKIAIESLEDTQAQNSLQREYDLLVKKYERNTNVVSPYKGIVVDIYNAPGDIVKIGDEIVTIEQSGVLSDQLEVVLFIPAVEGKKIVLGSLLNIDLSNIKSKQYGFVKSKVKYVSPYPATFRGMMRVLQNENVVNDILKQGPQVQIIGELIKSKNSYSGFEWTTGSGPQVKLQSGTFCTGEIKIESLAPIELVFPNL